MLLTNIVKLRHSTGQWSFLGLGSEKKWYSISEDSPQEMWDRIAEQMMIKFGIIFMSMFNDISCGSRDNGKIACQMPISFLFMQRDLEEDNGHSLVLVLKKKKWYSISEDSPQGEWDHMAERMLVEFAESGHPIFRVTSPLSRGTLKGKGGGKL